MKLLNTQTVKEAKKIPRHAAKKARDKSLITIMAL